jgi:hypothetical protein
MYNLSIGCTWPVGMDNFTCEVSRRASEFISHVLPFAVLLSYTTVFSVCWYFLIAPLSTFSGIRVLRSLQLDLFCAFTFLHCDRSVSFNGFHYDQILPSDLLSESGDFRFRRCGFQSRPAWVLLYVQFSLASYSFTTDCQVLESSLRQLF